MTMTESLKSGSNNLHPVPWFYFRSEVLPLFFPFFLLVHDVQVYEHWVKQFLCYALYYCL